ncbi:hypothetical protein BKX95_09995 [Streptococcus iniae]|nr:hypothetical protein BKX95_09995 [Streptococcus iniae]
MGYFITFGNFENVNLPKGNKMVFESGMKALSRQNDLLKNNAKIGFADFEISNTITDDLIACTVDFPEEDLFKAILEAVNNETDDIKTINNLTDILEELKTNHRRIKKSSTEQPTKQVLYTEKTSQITQVDKEHPIKKVEKSVESPSQHPKKAKKDFLSKQFNVTKYFKKKSLFYPGLLVLTIAILTLSLFGAIYKVNSLEKQLETKISQVQNQQNNQGKIDTFSRFFIPSYFSGKSQRVDPFVKSSLKGKIASDNATDIQSLLFNELKMEGNTYQATYIAYVKNDTSGSYKKITLSMKAGNTKYGYELIKAPKITDY